MCNSVAEGGRRCAGHLEPAFKKALKAYHDGGDELTNEMMHKILAPAKAYASTRTGASVINDLINDETRKQLEGEYKDFEFPPGEGFVGILDDAMRYYVARDYFIKNLPFTALLQIALEEGAKISNAYYERESDIHRIKKERAEALKAKLLLPAGSPKVKAAYSEIENAIESGEDLVAPAGSLGFKLTYSEDDRDGAYNSFLGIYQSVDDAKRAAVKKLLEILNIEGGYYHDFLDIQAPWGNPKDLGILEWNQAKVDWFKAKSDYEILEWAKSDMAKEVTGRGLHGTFSATEFEISPIKIETVETAYPEETHLED